MENLIKEIEAGLIELEKKLQSQKDLKDKAAITERAKKQLQKAQVSSLIKGEITKIRLIEDHRGHAWQILHNDQGTKEIKLYYFKKKKN
jgi:hypothetical protein